MTPHFLMKKVLDGFAEKDIPDIFGNTGKSVHPDKIGELVCLIILLKVENPIVSKQTNNYDGKPPAVQHRMKFTFKGTEYDLALTDPHFVEGYEADNKIIKTGADCYLTISLGVLHLGWYSKLVAGVIII